MKSFHKTLAALAGSILATLTPFSPSYAGNFLVEIGEIVTDPLKLRHSSSTLSDSLERTMIQISALERVANNHVAEHLERIKLITRDAINGTSDVINVATDSMLRIEQQVNADAVDLIYQAQCATDTLLKDSSQRAFAGFISTLKNAEPSVNILGVKVINLSTNEVSIIEPDKAYLTTKAAVMSKLHSDTTDTSKAYDIVSAYLNLEKGAAFVRCYFHDQTAAQVLYTKEINELERLSIPWVTVVETDINYDSKH